MVLGEQRWGPTILGLQLAHGAFIRDFRKHRKERKDHRKRVRVPHPTLKDRIRDGKRGPGCQLSRLGSLSPARCLHSTIRLPSDPARGSLVPAGRCVGEEGPQSYSPLNT